MRDSYLPLSSSAPAGRRLADQQVRSRTGPGPKLLNASVAHFGAVDAAIRTDCCPVHVQEDARVTAQPAPCIEQVPLAIVLHHFRRRILEGPYCTIAICVQEVDRGRIVEGPLIDELPVLVEYLHPAVPTIPDVDTPRHWIGGNAVDDLEIVLTRLPAATFACLTPPRDHVS